MGRKKVSGKRDTGIQAKSGKLYVVIGETTVVDGKKKKTKKWISTGLADLPENLPKARSIREKELMIRGDSRLDKRLFTVENYIDIYLKEKEREIKKGTYRSYVDALKHIRDYLGGIPVCKLTVDDVNDCLDYMFEEFDLQKETVKESKRLLVATLQKAIKDGVIYINVASEAKINASLAAIHEKEKKNEENFLSYDEACEFLNNVYDEDKMYYVMFYCSVFFGLRREEVLGLCWPAIDFNKKTLHIYKVRVKIDHGTEIRSEPKTAKSNRFYPLTDDQIDMFKCLKKMEDENRKFYGKSYENNDFLFKLPNGRLLHPDRPTKVFKRLLRKNKNLPQDVTLHGLRTSCISILVSEGYDIASIQEWVGHEDIETTLKYYTLCKVRQAKEKVSTNMSEKYIIKLQ